MKTIIGAVLIGGLAIYIYTWFYVTRIPEPIEGKFKVRLIDAVWRFNKALVTGLVNVGLTTPFSPLDRYLADMFILTKVTGIPWWSYTGPDLTITDMDMLGVHVRVYEPKSSLDQTQRPVVVYIHGGAWTMLSVDSYEPLTSRLAIEANVVVISVNYRQSPQFPFPVPRQDSMAVVKYVLEHPHELGVDPTRIALAGDSCGGNLAASLTLELQKSLSMQILMVPALQPANSLTPSAVENAPYFSQTCNDRLMYNAYLQYGGISLEAYPFLINNSHLSHDIQGRLSSSKVNVNDLVPSEVIRTPLLRRKSKQEDWIRSVPEIVDAKHLWSKNVSRVFLDPFFAPLLADDAILRHSPRTYVMTAGYDIIRDDGVMYHHRLKRLGVPGVWKHYPDAFHNANFFHSGPLKLTVGERIFKDVVDYIRLHL